MFFLRRISGFFTYVFNRLLPKPTYAPAVSDDEDDAIHQPTPSQSLITRHVVPPYGQRKGWKPSTPDDFGAFDAQVA